MPQAETLTHALKYPKHLFEPQDFVTFVQAKAFSKRWDALGLDDHDLQALEVLIMANPKGGPVIKGTGGLRKLRFSGLNANAGSRGALRVCYVFFEEFKVVLLLVVYQKSEKVDLTPSEKEQVREIIASTASSLSKDSYS